MKVKSIKSKQEEKDPEWSPWRLRIHEIIFEHDTFWGKTFDVALLYAILLSLLAVVLESVNEIELQYGIALRVFEWTFTIIFSIEYLLRTYSVKKPIRYILSFYGIIDLLAILPTYLSIFLVGGQYLMVIRTIRLLRVFRILKLARYIGEGNVLLNALKASRYKIAVFLIGVSSIVIITGTVMYLVEGPENGFTNIPTSIYWAIVTLTTVGYGDIAPQSAIGKTVASFIMLLGYAIIAVPTGIVTAEISQASRAKHTIRVCNGCSSKDHENDASYCKNCGEKLA